MNDLKIHRLVRELLVYACSEASAQSRAYGVLSGTGRALETLRLGIVVHGVSAPELVGLPPAGDSEIRHRINALPLEHKRTVWAIQLDGQGYEHPLPPLVLCEAAGKQRQVVVRWPLEARLGWWLSGRQAREAALARVASGDSKLAEAACAHRGQLALKALVDRWFE